MYSRIATASVFFLSCIGLFGGRTAQAQPGCAYPASPPQQSVPSGGGTGRITVAASAGCTWAAVSSDTSWLTITSGASGNGTGLVVFQALANNAGIRTATITIANAPIYITQPADPNPEAGISILMADLPGNRIMHMSNVSGANWEAGPLSGGGHSLAAPWHISQDAGGRIYIADRDNDRVVRMDDITGAGWTTFSGVSGKPLSQPRSVQIGPGGKIYIVDSSSRGIIRIDDMSGTNYVSFSGLPSSGGPPDETVGLCGPKVLTFDTFGRIYVTDTDHYRIVRINDMTGAGFTAYGLDPVPCGPAAVLTGRDTVGHFNRPEGIVHDGQSPGHLYITDNENHRIVRINDTMDGAGWATYGSLGAGVNQVIEPHDIKISPAGRIYILDTGNGRVVRLDRFDETPGNGWAAFGSRPNQLGAGNEIPPGFYEMIAPKGLWIGPALDVSKTCSYTMSPGHSVLAATGGSGSLVVAAPAACAWEALSNQTWLSVSGGGTRTGNGAIAYSALANPTATARVAVVAVGGSAIYITQPGLGGATMSVDRTSLAFSAVTASGGTFSAQTGSQIVHLLQSGAGVVGWQVSTTPANSWLTVSPGNGTGSAALTIGVRPNGVPASGTLTGIITISFTGATNVSATINVTFNLASAGARPFGSFDSPATGTSPLQGSLAVTGWALDDIAIDRVEIWRDLQPGETTPPFASSPGDPRSGKVFISNATFVDGARPDVEGLYPTTPFNYRAGWGYLLLTWGLWNQGNGTYNLYAFAFDTESNLTTLGQKTIVVSNSAANRPFGSIDTPGIGATVSGTVVNFGWGLTPKVNGTATCTILASGVQVSIDSGPLQPVTYGDNRSDIAGAFTGFSNTSAAGGHFVFDSTALTNGPHTIGWLITDSCNRADGVGSRFFAVSNGSLTAAPKGTSAAATTAIADRADMTIARGYGELPAIVGPDASGVARVRIAQGERIEVRLPARFSSAVQLVEGLPRELPAGASWDPNGRVFYWSPAPGFLGRFYIGFGTPVGAGVTLQVDVVPASPYYRQ